MTISYCKYIELFLIYFKYIYKIKGGIFLNIQFYCILFKIKFSDRSNYHETYFSKTISLFQIING
jgi:hypothetical protein